MTFITESVGPRPRTHEGIAGRRPVFVKGNRAMQPGSHTPAALYSRGDTPVYVPHLAHSQMLLLSFAFHDFKFCLSSQLQAASCASCSSEMPPSKQVNGHLFTICLIVWGSQMTPGYGCLENT